MPTTWFRLLVFVPVVWLLLIMLIGMVLMWLFPGPGPIQSSALRIGFIAFLGVTGVLVLVAASYIVFFLVNSGIGDVEDLREEKARKDRGIESSKKLHIVNLAQWDEFVSRLTTREKAGRSLRSQA